MNYQTIKTKGGGEFHFAVDPDFPDASTPEGKFLRLLRLSAELGQLKCEAFTKGGWYDDSYLARQEICEEYRRTVLLPAIDAMPRKHEGDCRCTAYRVGYSYARERTDPEHIFYEKDFGRDDLGPYGAFSHPHLAIACYRAGHLAAFAIHERGQVPPRIGNDPLID